MDITADGTAETLEERRGARRTNWLVLGTLGVVALGGWGAVRSVTALATRTEQLEREAAESEARVAELQALREGLTRRVHLLEQQHQHALATRPLTPQRLNALSARRDAARQSLEQLLRDERERGLVSLEETEGQLRLGLADPLLFAPGGTELTAAGVALVGRMGTALAVEGHLVQVLAWPDASTPDWTLSTARAVTVVRQLARETRLPPERLVALGHGLATPGESRLELRLVPAPTVLRAQGRR
jgi:chemotaxis protein MotB